MPESNTAETKHEVTKMELINHTTGQSFLIPPYQANQGHVAIYFKLDGKEVAMEMNAERMFRIMEREFNITKRVENHGKAKNTGKENNPEG
jgi:hypothetical protein